MLSRFSRLSVKAARPLAPSARLPAFRAFAADAKKPAAPAAAFKDPRLVVKEREEREAKELDVVMKEFEVAKKKHESTAAVDLEKNFVKKEGLQLYGESGKMAHALLDASIREKADLRRVVADLRRFQGLLDMEAKAAREKPRQDIDVNKSEQLAKEEMEKYNKQDPNLADCVKQSPLSVDFKINFLQTKFFPSMKEHGESLLPIVEKFIIMLVELKRFDKLYTKVITNFDELTLDHLKEVRGVVTSAEPLQKAALSKIEAKMKAQLKPGQTLSLETKVDPSILGGLVVVLGNDAQDLSARMAITRVEQGLRAASSGV